MPDRKTVYLTDDGTNTGLWKFIADKKNDVSSGECSIDSARTLLARTKCGQDGVWPCIAPPLGSACQAPARRAPSLCGGWLVGRGVDLGATRSLDLDAHLPAGALYGAKLTQAGAAGSVGNAATTSFTIEWVLLGRSNQVSLCDLRLHACHDHRFRS
jgi:hypothetical protein